MSISCIGGRKSGVPGEFGKGKARSAAAGRGAGGHLYHEAENEEEKITHYANVVTKTNAIALSRLILSRPLCNYMYRVFESRKG